MRNRSLRNVSCFVLLCCLAFASLCKAQIKPKTQKASKNPKATAVEKKVPVKIADEPHTVDPAMTMKKFLANPVTVDFTNSSLREVVEWLKKKQKITVLLNQKALTSARISLGEPIADQLNNEPLYLMLNRLQSLGLAWYTKDDILHITTTQAAKARMSTKPYEVGDLLDSEFERNDLMQSLYITGGQWDIDSDEGGGSAEWLGDVLFIKQTDVVHRSISGLLTALRKHGRRTLIFDPPVHQKLKEKLNEKISVDFEDTPLSAAIKSLSEKSKVTLRLDDAALMKKGIRNRQPVSLTLEDRKLSTVLQVLLSDFGLTWILKDGVISITTESTASKIQKTAIYDVRDLCQNSDESDALSSAIQSQTTQGKWKEADGEGGSLIFLKPGTMVVRHTERNLDDISLLLEVYRKALRESKPRKPKPVDDGSKEITTHYYRLNAKIADDLMKLLPQLVLPATWKTEKQPDAVGTIIKISSKPEILYAQGRVLSESKKKAGKANSEESHALLVARSVLIIRQTRGTHQKIADVIQRIESGDPSMPQGGQGFGGGGGFQGQGGQSGGGSFGGGFFKLGNGK